jgi:hypothetical protein
MTERLCGPRWMVLLAAACAAAGCGSSSAKRPMDPLLGGGERKKGPRAGGEPLELKVAQVLDPRLPRLDPEQLQSALADAEDLFQQTPGERKVKFRLGETFHVEVFFERYREVLAQPDLARARESGRLTGSDADLTVMEEDVKRNAEAIEAKEWRAAFPEAPADVKSAPEWAAHAFSAFKKRYQALSKAHGEHPAPVDAEHPEASSPWYWRALAARGEYDLIVTNCLIAEPERNMEPYRLARGGILPTLTVGTPNRPRWGKAAVVSVQPALCQAPFSLDLPADAVAHYVGAYLFHACHKEPDRLSEPTDPLALAARMIRLGQPKPSPAP